MDGPAVFNHSIGGIQPSIKNRLITTFPSARVFANPQSQQTNDLRAKGVNGEHWDHLAGPDGRQQTETKGKWRRLNRVAKTGLLRLLFIESHRFAKQFDHHLFALFYSPFA